MKKLTSFVGLCAALLIPAVVWTQSRQSMEVEGRLLWSSNDQTPTATRGQIPRSEKLRLAGLLHDVYLVHDTSDSPLTNAQRLALLNALRPWLNRPAMTDSQAATLNLAARKILTEPQLKEVERQRQNRMVFMPILDRHQEEELARKEKQMTAYLAVFNPVRPLVKDRQFLQLAEPLRHRIESRCVFNARLHALLKAATRTGATRRRNLSGSAHPRPQLAVARRQAEIIVTGTFLSS